MTRYLEEHTFNFDNVFGEDYSNQQIYLECVQPLVLATFQGAKTTCFAYGQTGSGKTHTMMGNPATQVPGLYLLAAQDIFSLMQESQFGDLFAVVSFYEIYCAKLFDLLNNREQLQCREDAKQVSMCF